MVILENKIVEIEGLTYTYPDGTKALTDVSLGIYPGESLGIVGANGTGKSTLLFHFNGILRGRGRVIIGGLKMADENIAAIRQRVGLVFQDPESQLFMPTVYEDVGFGPINMNMNKKDVDKAVHGALSEVDMLSKISSSSHHLSVGEKKRIAIATVLSMKPQILVMDEPTANLDPRHRRELIKLLNRLTMTKVIASHDFELIEQTCSRVVLMEEGRITAGGACREFLPEAAMRC
jgi:cobalt/nickel transport system ATP-binding protein